MPAPDLGQPAKHAVIGIEISVRACAPNAGRRSGGSPKTDAGYAAQGAVKEQWHFYVGRSRWGRDASDVADNSAV